MASIDERVVEMRFRRDDFNRGVAETLEGIKRLDDTLASSGGIADNVEKVSNRMGALGALGFTAIQRLGNVAIDTGAKIVSSVMDPIFKGGKQRALNIEQAEFMFEGLGINVEAGMKAANDAVLGTAYGLDEAALVAAQFGASGMKAGEDMTTSLRGIAGVAAMTGSSFGEIGQIFTTVSGNGHLMTMELRRLEQRGVNAAVEISKYLREMGIDANATEASVREMVRGGMIDFDTFSAAMSHSFGEHATKANETYTGSLSNMRAALSRIGADFASVKHEKHRRMFNALTPVINSVRSAMEPLVEVYERFAKMSARRFEVFMLNILENTNWEGIRGIFEGLGNGVLNLKLAFDSVVSPIVAAVKHLLNFKGEGEGLLAMVAGWAEAFQNWTESLILSDVQQEALTRNIIKFFDTIKMGLIPFEKLGELIDALGVRFPEFGAILDDIKGRFEEFGGGVLGVLKTVGSYIGDFIGMIMDFFGTLRSGESSMSGFKLSLDGVKDAFRGLGQWIQGVGISALNKLSEAWDYLIESIKGSAPDVSGITGMFGAMVDAIGTVLRTLKDAFVTAFSGISNAISAADPFMLLMAFQTILSNIMGFKLASGFSNLATGLGEGFKGMGDALANIGGTLRNTGDAIAGFIDNIGRSVQESKPKQILMLAAALAMLAGSIWLMSQIPTSDLVSGGAAIAVMMGLLVGALAAISKVMAMGVIAKLPATAFALLIFSAAIGILAIALSQLAKVPQGSLWSAVGVVAAMAAVLIGVTYAMNKMKPGPMIAASAALVIMAGALAIVAGVIALMGLLPWDVVSQGMIVAGTALAALVLAAVILEQFAPGMVLSAVGLMAMAAALGMLVIPLTTLGLLPYDVLQQGMIGILTILGALVLAAALLEHLAPSMALSAVGLIAMAVALNLLVIPITAIGLLPYDILAQGLLGLGIALAALVVAATMMQGLVAGAAGVIAIAAALLILAIAIRTVSEVPFAAGAAGLALLAGGLIIMVAAGALAQFVLPGLLAMAGLMIAFGFAAMAMGAAILLASVGIAIFSAVLPALASGLARFGSQAASIAPAIPLLALLGVAMIPLAAAAIALGAGMLLLGVGMTMLAASLMVLAASAPAGTIALMAFFNALDDMGLKQMAKIAIMTVEFAALGAALLVLGAGLVLTGAGAVLAAVGLGLLAGVAILVSMAGERLKTAFSGMEPMIATLNSMAASFTTLTAALTVAASGFSTLSSSLSGVTTSLTMVSIAIVLLATTATATATTVQASFMMMAAGMTVAALLIKVTADTIVQSITNMGSRISAVAPGAAAAVTVMVMLMVRALNVGRGQITSAITSIVVAFTLLGISLNRVGRPAATAVKTMMTSIVRELNRGSRSIPIAIARIVIAMAKLAAGINQNRTRSVNAVRSMMSSVTRAISSGGGAASSRAYSVGVAISNGMARGIRAGGGRVAASARSVAVSSMNSAKAALGVASPSKEFYKIAEFVIDGFVDGLDDGSRAVNRASSNLGEGSVDSVREAFEDIVNNLGDMSDFGLNPVITPVLDLSTVRDQASGLGGLLGLQSLDPSFNRGQASSLALLEEAMRSAMEETEPKDPEPIQYNQYNYSPKALSSAEIYRQTKNQISMASRRR